jgi:hypothetical protein
MSEATRNIAFLLHGSHQNWYPRLKIVRDVSDQTVIFLVYLLDKEERRKN